MKSIAIIGGGPSGLFCAYQLAKSGYAVTVYEEHSRIGTPIQCTGLVTKDIDEILPGLSSSGAIVNTIDSLEVHTKHRVLRLKGHEYVLDRSVFDSYIGSLARKCGATICTGMRFIRVDTHGCLFRDKNKKEEFRVTPDILIGADGPLSKVRKYVFNQSMELYNGIQAVVKRKGKSHTYTTYLGDDFPCFFGWEVPQGNSLSRIGLATKHNAPKFFDSFCKRLGVNKKDIVGWQSGPIPIFNKRFRLYRSFHGMHVFLIGDAAGQVKSTTGGGIVMHLRSGMHLSRCITQNTYTHYTTSLLYKHNRQMFLHLFARKFLDTFSDYDYDGLVNMFDTPRIRQLLATYSRDSPQQLIPRLLLAQPGLFRYTHKSIIPLLRSFRS